MPFTPEELAAIRAADAELEQAEREQNRMRDSMRHKAYYEANKERIKAKSKAYREAWKIDRYREPLARRDKPTQNTKGGYRNESQQH